MHLNPYGEDPMRLAVDLANNPPSDAAELTARCVDAGVIGPGPGTEADFRATKRFLDAWLEVVDAPTPDEKAQLLNRLLAQSSAHPRLSNHNGLSWHIHYRDLDLPLSGVLAALFSVGTALHLTQRGMSRLGRCAAHDCEHVFADVSRNGRQRYCSPACANRDAVRRHRLRSAASAPARQR